ncbi:helix-turn-helix domain-containing protein [Sphingomonas sp. PL-96]|uniref:helix-turn-helix domain-containing protein n=1 Tax=Sphingomonas sp. PL-96 TaxID=2887201 RepID=UPI001E421D70|nr:helix-turn-helix transcriptional regulator [Sphingomonas sp. PL-96]MCC2978424.1 helix-turn-helix domain-containing protein [Sphingomonas sp. PL-96]
MDDTIFTTLGEQLRGFRIRRGLSQPAIAQRLGRDRARISELERDLLGSRWGRDRLTLLAEMCDALDVVPVLVPRAQAAAVRAGIDGEAPEARQPAGSAFDELFVDLEDEG